MASHSRIMERIARWTAGRYLGRPDQAEILLIKYPRLRDLPAAFLNECCFRLGLSRSFRLTALNVELTNRCNLDCGICPRRGGGGRPECDLDFETFKRIIDATPHLKILLPYQWGEPLLSPVLVPAIEYASGRGIRVMVTTNGMLLDAGRAEALLQSGLERLTVSFDGDPATCSEIRGIDAENVVENIRRFRSMRDAGGHRCALDVSMVVDEATEPRMDAFRRLFENLADRIQFVPRFTSAPRRTACRELWRGVLVVLSSGDVTICCADHEGRGVLGNVAERMPVELFNGPEMRRLRKQHLRADYPALCRDCGEYACASVSPRFQ
jgi:sulfatase maturation enzyme AslB (radical SAM superfamily)